MFDKLFESNKCDGNNTYNTYAVVKEQQKFRDMTDAERENFESFKNRIKELKDKCVDKKYCFYYEDGENFYKVNCDENGELKQPELNQPLCGPWRYIIFMDNLNGYPFKAYGYFYKNFDIKTPLNGKLYTQEEFDKKKKKDLKKYLDNVKLGKYHSTIVNHDLLKNDYLAELKGVYCLTEINRYFAEVAYSDILCNDKEVKIIDFPGNFFQNYKYGEPKIKTIKK